MQNAEFEISNFRFEIFNLQSAICEDGVRSMRKWFILAGIVSVLVVGAYFALSYHAVKFIRGRLEKVVGPGLTFTSIEVKPTYLSAKGIQYEDPHSKRIFLKIEEMRIYPDLSSSLKGSLRIRQWAILQPSFFFYRSKEGTFQGPWVSVEKEEKRKETFGEEERKKEGPSIHIQVDRFRVENGSVDFEDEKVQESPVKIMLRAMDLEVENIQYPLVPLPSPVEGNGRVKGRTKDGNFEMKGWVNLATMDMDTSFKAGGIEVKTFEPYYRKRASAEIESGYINMEAKVAIKKRVIDAPGELELVDLRIKEGGGTILWIPAKTLVSLLEQKGNRIKVHFRVEGNEDDPRFSIQEAFLTQVALSLAQALGIPVKIVGEEVLRGAIKGERGLAESLKSIEELFKRKKEKGR